MGIAGMDSRLPVYRLCRVAKVSSHLLKGFQGCRLIAGDHPFYTCVQKSPLKLVLQAVHADFA